MKLTLAMDMDNAAFRGDEEGDFPGHEAARILNRVAVSVAAGHGSGKLRDVNGNTVGSWEIAGDEDEGPDVCGVERTPAYSCERTAGHGGPHYDGTREWSDAPDSSLEPEDIPEDHPVQPLEDGEPAERRVTCGHCGLSWDDAIVTSMTPAPSARCPFEPFHVYPDDEPSRVY